MSDYVLDASALIAFIRDEPGAERTRATLSSASISAVNLAEVGARMADLGFEPGEIFDEASDLRLKVVAFDNAQAKLSARLRQETRDAGLSLGDRACLALARQLDAIALTTDRAWASLNLDIEIELIR